MARELSKITLSCSSLLEVNDLIDRLYDHMSRLEKKMESEGTNWGKNTKREVYADGFYDALTTFRNSIRCENRDVIRTSSTKLGLKVVMPDGRIIPLSAIEEKEKK